MTDLLVNSEANSETALKSYLSQSAVKSYSPKDVFFCPEESQFYSQCLEKMVLNPQARFSSVVEFGAGDGSPVINCLLKTKFDGSIQGYELNPAACELAQSRIEQYKLNHKYTVHNKCFFSNASADADYLIANPPYLPAPDNDICMPALHGGADGAAITKQLLTIGCDSVFVMLSAYSNPVETIEYAIEQGYQTVDFMVSPLRFGYYSSEHKVKTSIEELHQQGKAFYSQNIYLLAGVLFNKRCSANIDLSDELIKVMTAL